MSSHDFLSTLSSFSSNPCFVLDKAIPLQKYVPIDLSVNNHHLDSFNLESSVAWEAYITNYCKVRNAQVAFGGYLEKRNIYKRSNHFNAAHLDSERNIHLGIDLWTSVETPIFVPLDGVIHSYANNTNFGDYGPTIILKHEINGFTFHTLYGHLSMESIENKKIGQVYKTGDHLATLGSSAVNGDYAPHLHFQIIIDIENYHGDYPGVCSQSNVTHYQTNCPDPNLLLRLA
ncbi:peptidase M23 [Hanstruepera neustonica]|uniref:Peptidase M23 n=1 Tax=Hanstruepera neustonica TaxID=1445657 RepID=A0A2K1DVX8_9FLAO|nr:peptidoglycan DD-metalloendopeptidase family protein [Hanstruepera neustonica]PNQ72129.1 peptidase M23 [Hanstruepera neustonica]